MNEREPRIAVSAGAVGYTRTIRYKAALEYAAAHDHPSSRVGSRYGAASAATNMWEAEVLHLIVSEGMDEEAAELEAEKRCEPGSEPEHLLEHARRVRREEERRMGRERFVGMYAETLAEMWSRHKGDHSGDRYGADDLTEIYERPAEDAERKELLDYVPGSEEELREVLSRRRGR
jgi:hypothetical protein